LISACEAGLTPEEFWRLSWRELDAVLIAHQNNKEEAWRHTRELVAMSYNNVIAPRQKRIKLTPGKEMIPLPSDEPIDIRPLSTLAEFKRYCKKMNIDWNPIPN